MIMKTLIFCIGLILSSHFVFSQNISIKDNLYYQNDSVLYTGKYDVFFNDGKTVQKQITIKEGKLNGEVIEFFENGIKKEVGQYNNNLKYGLWFRYNASGVLTAQASYKNDLKDGEWVVYDDNGKKLFQMEYKEGVKTGMWYQWNETGDLVKTTNYNHL